MLEKTLPTFDASLKVSLDWSCRLNPHLAAVNQSAESSLLCGRLGPLN